MFIRSIKPPSFESRSNYCNFRFMELPVQLIPPHKIVRAPNIFEIMQQKSKYQIHDQNYTCLELDSDSNTDSDSITYS